MRLVQRVDDRVHDRGRRADVRRLADALGSERVVRARRDRLAELEVGALERGRDQVVHERRVEAVALLVERDQLHQRDADALGEAAVDLAVDDHRVDATPQSSTAMKRRTVTWAVSGSMSTTAM